MVVYQVTFGSDGSFRFQSAYLPNDMATDRRGRLVKAPGGDTTMAPSFTGCSQEVRRVARGMIDFLRKISGRATQPVQSEAVSTELKVLLHGHETYPFDLVGSAASQNNVQAILARTGKASGRHKCLATLAIEGTVSAGPAAVEVSVGGMPIGHLPVHLAAQYRAWVRTWSLKQAIVYCHVLLLHDPDNAVSQSAAFRVRLYVEMPFKMTTLLV